MVEGEIKVKGIPVKSKQTSKEKEKARGYN